MSGIPSVVEVAVVGGGPVGLAVGALLAREGVAVIVLERRAEGHGDSRSIGIHPPSLAALEPVGASAELVRSGVCVRKALAFGAGGLLGELSFDRLPGAHPFVLTVPQDVTEAILAERLRAYAPGALIRCAEVRTVFPHDRRAVVSGVCGTREGEEGGPFTTTARFVIACDGRKSVVRRSLGIGYARAAYPDAYVMGDVADDTDLAADAAIFLAKEGVVESFPLPGGRRRWVVKTPRRVDAPSAGQLADAVEGRVGIALDPSSCTMVSAFGVERGRADRMVAGSVLLAGDSGHVIPPIGGQGMNMGWLDAAELAPRLLSVLAGADPADALRTYAHRRERAWRRASSRAEFNLRLGRATRWTGPRDMLVRGMLARGVAPFMARRFTMHGLS